MSATHPPADDDGNDVRLSNRFSQMHAGPENRSARIADEQRRFEHERVRFFLTRLKLRHHMKPIAREWQTHCGNFELRFAAVNNHFPTLPFLFGASTLRGLPLSYDTKVTASNYQVHLDPYSTEPSRFKKFSWVPFVAAYKEFYDTVAASAAARKVALVFPRKGFLHGMVIHNDDSEQFWTHGLSWVYKVPDRGTRLYVQPFPALVDGMYDNGLGWKP